MSDIETASALRICFISPNENDQNGEEANVVDGLFAIARSLSSIADALHRLGTAGASTPMGAIELLAKEVKDGCTQVATAISLHEE